MHPYHGIVLSQGHWRVQIRANEKLRMIRTFSVDVELSARRHDIAMKCLEPFIRAELDPNFPDEYDSINQLKWSEDLERLEELSEIEFRKSLMKLRSDLTAEFFQLGFDLETQQKYYNDTRAHTLRVRAARAAVGTPDKRRQLTDVLSSVATKFSGQLVWLGKMTPSANLAEAEIALVIELNKKVGECNEIIRRLSEQLKA